MCVSGRRIPLRSHFDSSTMPRGRVACWKASNPSETGRELAKVLEPHVEAIVRLGERIYPSAPFNQKDIHPRALDNQAPILKDLRLLDPRGCHFSQDDMLEALHIGIIARELGGTIKVHAEARGITDDEFKALVAMKIRVMCSHERSRHPPEVKVERDEAPKKKNQAPPIPELPAARLRRRGCRVPAGLSRVRWQARLGGLLGWHPRACDLLQSWTRRYDPRILEHWCLLGVGGAEQLSASSWRDHRWPGCTDPKKKTAGPTSSAKAENDEKKAEKAEGKAEDNEAPEEQHDDVGEEDEADDFQLCLSQKPGHDFAVCLFLHTNDNDKAQLLQVSPQMVVGTAHSPASVVEFVKGELKGAFDALPRLRVKQLPKHILQDMRATAKELRHQFLNHDT